MARQPVRSTKNGTFDSIEVLSVEEGYAAALIEELRQYRARRMPEKADAVLSELERIAPGSTQAHATKL
jgi:hypothetical protein